MGAIVIAAVSGSGALTALVNTIGSYLGRDHRTEVEIQTPDGRKVRISSQAFKPAELEETLRPLLGPAGEIGNYQARHERERQRGQEQLERNRQLEREHLERERQSERERLISTARVRLGAYVALGELTEEQVEEALALLKRDEARLFPRDRRYRDDLIRFSKGEASYLEVFGAGHILRPVPAPQPPKIEARPPIASPYAVGDAPRPPPMSSGTRTGGETSGEGRATAPGRGEYMVWYATNRRPKDPRDANKGFSAQRDRTVHYGSCRVFIPKSHKIGSTGSPWWKRILSWTDDRLKLLETRDLDAATYWQSLAMHFDNIAQDDKSGVVFLHGYNVSFSDAALRAAQIGFRSLDQRSDGFFQLAVARNVGWIRRR